MHCDPSQYKQKSSFHMHIYSLKYTKPSLWQLIKGLWLNICRFGQYSYEKIYIWDKCVQSLLGLTFIDWGQAWTTFQHNIY